MQVNFYQKSDLLLYLLFRSGKLLSRYLAQSLQQQQQKQLVSLAGRGPGSGQVSESTNSLTVTGRVAGAAHF